ncbi:aminoacyl-histidine dipeptidase [Clostridium massiliamazoniense]|uniref:aminoacyl-histidine dipeptidase n=1 Tax=Clostridium massiliamazoniense TaxID=1347366 RepID=UPI0006D77DF0|nr:aminoacyl-histidine dipeptidase [Clostridium massiliamazoniense]
MAVLENLKPQAVFKYFEEITQIPRGSGNEKEISDYLVKFGKELGLETIQDEHLNVIIRKPATKGYENAKTVIIQGHMDMVCEKNKDTVHDFEKDPLKLRIDGDNIYATGTTLGADNGIAVAYGLAILAANDIEHPAIELLVTTDEEAGMTGAMGVDGKNITGKILLNIDSEEEGEILVSCAGGVRTKAILDLTWEPVKEELSAVEITIRGLKGGHSGMEINKERGNSNKILGRILNKAIKEVPFNIALINGGSKNNAIPREAEAVLIVEEKNISRLKEIVAEFDSILKNELRAQDGNVRVELNEQEEIPTEMFSADCTRKAIDILNLIPNGVDTMSVDMPGLVQSSTNIGVVTTTDKTVEYDSATRSSVATLKDDLVERARRVVELAGGRFETSSDYPAWEYNPESEIRELAKEVYKNLTGVEPHFTAIHAGVECGLLSEKVEGGLDMISFGPNMWDVHTPDEHVSIKSIENVWIFLIALLKEIK